MAKQLNIDLKFNADVTAAVTNLRNLQQSLTAISATPMPIGTKISSEMQTAINSAKQLQFHLTNAFNTKTGNLDLTKLNTSLKASGQNLSDLSAGLLNAGMKGEQAFINIQRAVTTAGVQINNTQTMMGQFLTTLKNTARWQLSSSLLHGFVGGLSSAIGYAKDLDKSLNNIRIVTGYSSDYMAEFAQEANKAAKALNTTTTKYTDASLIYFQQGLSKEEVKERADITVKMANVTQQSAEIVSDQLTAVWNNFDDGTKSLEYYADVMTALGAATASSSDEIAGGLEKFAAVGETIGLSYEYAASALATITANTRQSEEVVGTALKTIFARIQGLKLGETLEDGTTLNKYSQALETVGVHIYNAQGGLKDMDSILDDLGKKWQTLTSDQQTALAQTVAGLRQYNQFISLMDNWDDGTSDSMVANLETSYNAAGALQDQADLYAESWAAASDKVKASLEDVWNSLIPTEGIIDVTNGFAQILDVLVSAIEGFGGFKSILLMISSIVLTKMGPSIAAGIDQGLVKIQEFGNYALHLIPNSIAKWKTSLDTTNTSYSVMNNHLGQITKQTTNAAQQTAYYEENLKGANEVLNQSQASISKAVNGGQILTDTFKTYISDMSQINNLQALITKNSNLLTNATKEQLSGLQQQLLMLAEKKAQEKDTLELLEAQKESLISITNNRMQNINATNSDRTNRAYSMEMGNVSQEAVDNWGRLMASSIGFGVTMRENNGQLSLFGASTQDIQSTVTGMVQTYSEIRVVTEEIGQVYKDSTLSAEKQSEAARKIIEAKVREKSISSEIAARLKEQLGIQEKNTNSAERLRENLRGVQRETSSVISGLGFSNRHLIDINNNAIGIVNSTSKWKQYVEEYKNVLQQTAQVMQNGLQSALSWGGALQGLASGASKVAMGLNSVMNFIEQLKSGDADFTTVLVSGTMALSIGLSGLMTVLGGVSTLISTIQGKKAASLIIDALKIASVKEETEEEAKLTLAKIAESLQTKLGMTEDLAAAGAQKIYTAAKEGGTKAAIKATMAQMGLNASLLPMLAIVAALAIVIGAIVIGYQKWKESTPEAKLKAAQEESKALTEQLNKTKEEVDSLKAAFDDYDKVAKKLAECKKGTEEWNEALRENNDKVRELLQQYPELATMEPRKNEETGQIEKAIGIDENGVLTIADWAMEIIIDEANIAVATATFADTMGKERVREADIEKQRGDLEWDKFDLSYGSLSKVSNSIEELQKQGFSNIYQTGDEEYTGFKTNWVDDAIDDLINKYGVEASKHANEIDGITQDQADQLGKVVESEFALRQAIEANTSATLLERQSNVDNIMTGSEPYETSEYQDMLRQVIANNEAVYNPDSLTVSSDSFKGTKENRQFITDYSGTASDKLIEDYEEALRDKSGWSSAMGDRAVIALKEYLEAMGQDSNKLVSYKHTEDGIEYQMQGQKEPQTVGFNTAATTLAGQHIESGVYNYGEIMAQQYASFGQEQAEIFTLGLTNSGDILSESTIGKSREEIEAFVDNMQIGEETLKAMGYELEKIDEDQDGIVENAEHYEKELKKQLKQQVENRKQFNEFAKDYQSNMDKIAAGGDEATKAAKTMGEQIKGALDIHTDLDDIITPEFIKENQQLFDNFANGIEGSAEEMRKAIGEQIWIRAGLDATAFDTAYSDLNNRIMEAKGMGLTDLEFGASLNEQPVLDSLSNIMNQLIAAGYTAEEAGQMMVDSLGIDVETEEDTSTQIESQQFVDAIPKEKTITGTYANPVTGEPTDITYTGVEYELKPAKMDSSTTKTVTGVKVKNAKYVGGGNINKIKSNTVTKNPTGGNINPKGSGGGGGKNTPKDKSFKEKDKKEAKLYEDEFDRYYDITQALEKYNRELEETQERKDELWGTDKLAVMDAEKKKLGEITEKQKEYLKAISGSEDGTFKDGYLKTDMNALKQLDPDAKFDENGKLINYEELTQKWLKELNSAQEVWNTGMENATNTFNANKKSEGADEAYDTTKTGLDDALESAEDTYEKRKAALDKWQETYDLNEEQKQQLEDHLRQMRQLNYEELEYKIEVRVEINENDIADIEHQLERIGDNNVYESAERIALIEKNAASYRNIADIQMAAIKEAEQLYATGQITQTDYMARLQESKEALQEAEMSIRDGITQIGDELENTFDLIDEKLDQQFTKFDQLIELMDHYKNVVSLTEGEASYKEFNKILKASQEVLRDRIAVDESEVAMWESRRKQLEADIATLPEDSPAKREAEEALQAIMEKEADAKSQLMADIEQLGEYAREIFENSIEQAMKDFEDEMFGRPLNSIIESIEMMNSRQEELLTTTNKIYETNKLIRNVEKDIEATTNNRVKQAFAEFQNKVKQKQEQNELTKFELDLLTAEYEMTKAQIALEEAQNAKDTVRLTRDAEGNYGYVYTANEDKVADAEQALDDATNNYYNTALEGAQKYQDQIYQHIQEWEEKVKEVYLDQTLSEEEKNKKIKEINDTYNTLITQDKNLYYMAVGAMQESAYNTQVDYDLKGIESAENWFTECDGFLSDLEDAQDEYDRNTKEVSEHTEENFGKMSTAIRNTKRESEYLKDQIVDELVPELDTTLKDSIDNATEAWWKYIEALQRVIELTDEAMQKNSDEKYQGAIDDFSQEIYDKISSGEYNINDPEIQALIERRWKKMGGEDNYDYTAMMNATDDPIWDSVYNTLREYKIANTDWMAKIQEAIKSGKKLSDIQWMIDIRDEKQKKLGQTPDSLEQAKKYAETIGATLATGGYTGSWGPEGRLAVLHEKELVLNAEDTKNFLSATGILREISQMLDRDALIASLGAINLRAMTLNSPADQVLQQEVTIHADFPNVTDHNEIELAIDNLINAASQHAYRT